ncbi:MAG: phosphotransferase system HPr-like phosphotransfer protein [Planctomycetota bacterium]
MAVLSLVGARMDSPALLLDLLSCPSAKPAFSTMSETSLDKIISEERFAEVLGAEAEMFFRIANSVQQESGRQRRRQYLYQLGIEADLVESFLDDHGAKHNESFCFFRELVASVRGFAQVGFALEHLDRRFDSYGTLLHQVLEDREAFLSSITQASAFVVESIFSLLDAIRSEADLFGVQIPAKLFPEERYTTGLVNLQLPHNLGDEEIEDDGHKIAEVASKYLQVCAMFREAGVRAIHDPVRREEFFARACNEQRARVYEATVHNLQSAYDTHLLGSTLERSDDRLPSLRGHASAAFHLLEAVTGLVHFVERHEAGARVDDQKRRIGECISRERAREVTLNNLLYWSSELILLGGPLAREILSSFSNLQELVLEVPEGITIHARPASLIVAIVNHHDMPVEMEVDGKVCNAASILEVLINAGSNAEESRYTFRGDAGALADLDALFQCGLGERGLDEFPDRLGYLRS